jgi:hypothetical protein
MALSLKMFTVCSSGRSVTVYQTARHILENSIAAIVGKSNLVNRPAPYLSDNM